MKVIWDPTLGEPTQEAFISLTKPLQIMERIGKSAEIITSWRVERIQLARAHDLRYVEGAMRHYVPNGFGNCEVSVMTHALAANGVMIKAVQEVLKDPARAVFAPVSGFHHAHYAEAEGYCTFNGLIVAIMTARIARAVPRVLIIDGDGHYGNGTDDILNRLALSGITNLTHNTSPKGLNRKDWFNNIREALDSWPWDLVLYQAGADAHKDDPYMVGYLTDEEWEARDALVATNCRRRNLPLVVNLAGGYNGVKTIDLHMRTYRTLATVYRSALPDRLSSTPAP